MNLYIVISHLLKQSLKDALASNKGYTTKVSNLPSLGPSYGSDSPNHKTKKFVIGENYQLMALNQNRKRKE